MSDKQKPTQPEKGEAPSKDPPPKPAPPDILRVKGSANIGDDIEADGGKVE